mgnify:CR=1 FL=1
MYEYPKKELKNNTHIKYNDNIITYVNINHINKILKKCLNTNSNSPNRTVKINKTKTKDQQNLPKDINLSKFVYILYA